VTKLRVSVFDAADAVSKAREAVASAVPGTQAYSRATAELAAAEEEHRKALLAYTIAQTLATPAAFQFRNELDQVKLRLAQTGAAIGSVVLPQLTQMIRVGSEAIPFLGEVFQRLATRINESALALVAWVRSSNQINIVRATLFNLGTIGATVFNILSQGALIFLNALRPLMLPTMELLFNINRLTGATLQWTASARGQAIMGQVWDSLRAAAALLWQAVLNLVVGFAGLFNALRNVGAFTQILGFLVQITAGFRAWTSEMGTGSAAIQRIWTLAQPIFSSLGNLAGVAATQFGRVTMALIGVSDASGRNLLVNFIDTLSRLLPPVATLLIHSFEVLGPLIPPLAEAIARFVLNLHGAVAIFAPLISGLTSLLNVFNSLPSSVQTVVGAFLIWNAVSGALGRVLGLGGGGLLSTIWEAIKTAIALRLAMAALNMIFNTQITVTMLLTKAFTGTAFTLKQLLLMIPGVSAVSVALTAVWTSLTAAFWAAISGVGTFVGALIALQPWAWAIVAAVTAVGLAVYQIYTHWATIGPWLQANVIGPVTSFVGSLATAGWNMMMGFLEGIARGAAEIARYIGDFLSSMVNAVTSFLGIRSPSTVMMSLGEATSQGFIEGVLGQTPQAQAAATELASTYHDAFSNYMNSAGGFKDDDLQNDWITHLPDRLRDEAVRIAEAAQLRNAEIQAASTGEPATVGNMYAALGDASGPIEYPPLPAVPQESVVPPLPSIAPPAGDSFAANSYYDPNRGKPGYTQAEDGSWVAPGFYGGDELPLPATPAAAIAPELPSIAPPDDDSFASNSYYDPNRGAPGYTQVEDGSWVPPGYFGGGATEPPLPATPTAAIAPDLPSITPPIGDSFAANSYYDPNRGMPGYTQAEDGSWVAPGFYGGTADIPALPEVPAEALVPKLPNISPADMPSLPPPAMPLPPMPTAADMPPMPMPKLEPLVMPEMKLPPMPDFKGIGDKGAKDLQAGFKQNEGGIFASIGGIFDRVKNAASSSLDWLRSQWASRLAPTIVPALSALADAIFSGASRAFEGLRSAASSVINFLRPAWTEVSTFFIGQGERIAAWWRANLPLMKQVWDGLWNGIRGVVTAVWGAVSGFVVSQGQRIMAWWRENLPAIRQVTDTAFRGVQAVIQAVLNALMPVIKGSIDFWTAVFRAGWAAIKVLAEAGLAALTAAWRAVGGPILEIVRSSWNMIKTVISTAIGAVLSTITAVLKALTGDWRGAWRIIQDNARTTWEAIKTLVREAINIVVNIIKIPLAAIVAAFKASWGVILPFLTSVWNAIAGAARSIWGNIVAFFSGIFNRIRTVITGAWSGVSTQTSTTWNGIRSLLQAAGNAIVAIWQAVAARASVIWGGVRTALSAIWNGIVSAGRIAFQLLQVVVMAPIILVVAAAILIWERFGTQLTAIWNRIRAAASAIWNAITDAIRSVIQAFVGFAIALWDRHGDEVTSVWNRLRGAAQSAFDAIRNVITAVWNAVSSVTRTVWDAITNFLSEVWEREKRGLTIIYNAIRDTVTTVWNAVRDFTRTVWEAITTFLSEVWEREKRGLTIIYNAIKDTVTTVWNAIRDFTRTVWEAITNFLSEIWEREKRSLTIIYNAIKDTVTTVWNAIRDVTRTVWDAISAFLTRIWEAIRELFRTALDAVSRALRAAWEAIRDTTSRVWNGIRDFFGDIWRQITEAFNRALDTIKRAVESSWNAIKEIAVRVWRGIAHAIVDPFIDTANAVIDIWNKVSGAIAKALDMLNIAPDIAKALGGADIGRIGNPLPFAEGGLVKAYATGGMGTASPEPRMHLWNEQMGNEAFIAERGPKEKQISYLSEAASWFDLAVVPHAMGGMGHGHAHGDEGDEG
ncbi:MAG: hypothetical protein M3P49_03790, partial [Actinomycetota bacterium]|nr:hypothetical protein [Actinomycetota bacterium]